MEINPYVDQHLIRLFEYNPKIHDINKEIICLNTSKQVYNAIIQNKDTELKRHWFGSRWNKIIRPKSKNFSYKSYNFYPEDSLEDVRYKISDITGILPNLLHIFYIHNNIVSHPYQINIYDIEYKIDIDDVSENTGLRLLGLHIDQYMENNKKDVKIYTKEQFSYLGGFITDIYYTDLNNVMDKGIDSYNLVNDDYQLDLLYYGGILKYWPRLTIQDIKQLITGNYHPNESQKIHMILSQQEFIDAAYSSKYQIRYNIIRSLLSNLRTYGSFANIRNLFDWIHLSKRIPLIILCLDHKKYIKEYIPKSGILSELEINKIISPFSKNNVLLLLFPYNENFIRFAIFDDGYSTIDIIWGEKAQMTYELVINDTYHLMKPILGVFKNLGSVFGSLPAEKLVNIKQIKGLYYWKHAISLEGFKYIYERLQKYERAGLLYLKNVNRYDTITLHFLKGVTYNKKIEDSQITNQYEYLWNQGYLQQWKNTYNGKIVKFIHKINFIKIEVHHIANNAEMLMILRYMISFLNNILKERNPKLFLQKYRGGPKSLKERDPELYDVKKHDPNAKTYSILCQSDRQPYIYNEKELGQIPKKWKKRIVKYWNFTEKRPAYYVCPSDRFPALNFQYGHHPKNYCLPCCKKSMPTDGSQGDLINKTCIKHPETVEEKLDITRGKLFYILNYGKTIPVDRISEIPNILYESIFISFEKNRISGGAVTSRDDNLFIYGINQEIRTSINNAGYMLSIIYALEYSGISKDVIKDLIKYLSVLKNQFNLICGIPHSYVSYSKISKDLLNTFVMDDPGFNSVSANGILDKQWINIIRQLILLRFDIDVLMITDAGGRFNISLQKKINDDIKYLILLNNVDNGTINPIVLIENYKYFGKNFKKHDKKPQMKMIFDKNDKIIYNDVVNIIGKKIAEKKYNDLDLNLIEKICEKETQYKFTIDTYFVNLHDQCYGIYLTSVKGNIYSPITPTRVGDKLNISSQFPDKTILNLGYADISQFFKTIAKYIKIEKKSDIEHEGKIIGFSAECNQQIYLFYHTAISASASKEGKQGKKDSNVRFPYNPIEINRAIYNYHMKETKNKIIDQVKEKERYENNLYKLFLTEFANELYHDKNINMRNRIKELINKTNLNNDKEVTNFRIDINKLLKNYDLDIQRIFNIVKLKNSIKLIDNMKFDFDKNLLIRLRNTKDHEKVKNNLTQIMKKNVTIVKPKDLDRIELTNMYVTCKIDSEQTQCRRNKLMMTDETFENYCDILASDILNPLKDNFISSLSPSGVFNYYDYSVRPNELIREI